MIFFFRPPLDPLIVDAFARQQDAFRQAAALFSPPVETVRIPYENTTLPGYFLTPSPDRASRPTLIITDGYDGPVEELSFVGSAAALQRGYNCLIFDGPGQGAALIEQGLYFRPDWENVVLPVVDHALTRPEVDPARIVLMGRSWGGYLAPRAATAEHRLAALIADAVLEAVMRQNLFIAFSINRGMLTHGVPTPIAYARPLAPYTVEGLAQQIRCPTMIREGESDVRGGDAKPLNDALVAPKEYILFANAEGAGAHDESGAASLFSQRVFDWLDGVLVGSARVT